MEKLTVKDQQTIKCVNCDKKLLHIVLVEDNENRLEKNLKPISSQFKAVKCPKCNHDSFWSKVFHGTTILGTTNENMNIELEDTETVDGVIKTTVSVTSGDK